MGSNPLLDVTTSQSSAQSSSTHQSSSPVISSPAVIVSITQHNNGLLTAPLAPSPITLHVRPTSSNAVSFLQACITPLQQNLDSVHNYRRAIALQLRPQILAALSTPDDVKIGCDMCIVLAPDLDEAAVGLDVRARVDACLSVRVGDVRFDVDVKRIAAAAAIDTAAAAAGLSSHSLTHHVLSLPSLRLRGSVSGTAPRSQIYKYETAAPCKLNILLMCGD